MCCQDDENGEPERTQLSFIAENPIDAERLRAIYDQPVQIVSRDRVQYTVNDNTTNDANNQNDGSTGNIARGNFAAQLFRERGQPGWRVDYNQVRNSTRSTLLSNMSHPSNESVYERHRGRLDSAFPNEPNRGLKSRSSSQPVHDIVRDIPDRLSVCHGVSESAINRDRPQRHTPQPLRNQVNSSRYTFEDLEG